MLIHDEIYIHVRHGRQGPFRVGPITWLQLDFLGLVGTMSHDISANELHLHVPSQQKMKRLDGLIPKLAKFSSNGKHQLLTRMPQAPHVFGGLMLIPIFMTHFVQA